MSRRSLVERAIPTFAFCEAESLSDEATLSTTIWIPSLTSESFLSARRLSSDSSSSQNCLHSSTFAKGRIHSRCDGLRGVLQGSLAWHDRADRRRSHPRGYRQEECALAHDGKARSKGDAFARRKKDCQRIRQSFLSFADRSLMLHVCSSNSRRNSSQRLISRTSPSTKSALRKRLSRTTSLSLPLRHDSRMGKPPSLSRLARSRLRPTRICLERPSRDRSIVLRCRIRTAPRLMLRKRKLRLRKGSRFLEPSCSSFVSRSFFSHFDCSVLSRRIRYYRFPNHLWVSRAS